MSKPKSKHWRSMLFNKIVGTVCIFFAFNFANAQKNRYLVFFNDKTGSAYDISNPSLYLSQKAIDRRSKQNIAVTSLDLPVNENYIQGIRDIGIEVFFKTRWLNGILVQCDAAMLPDIEALSFVKTIEFIAPGERLTSGGRKKSVSETQEGGNETATTKQLNMLGIDSMHQQGYHGEGITIAVMDSGFPNVNTSTFFQHLVTENRIDIVSHDFVFNTTDVFRYDQHGAKVFSVMAAYKPDTFTGSAYGANFQLYVTEDIDTEYRIEEYNWLFAAERADSAGADIISTSLGYNSFDDGSMDYELSDIDGNTAVISKAAQFAADRGILVICTAGNEGGNSWGLITPPADAKDVVAIANVNIFGERSATSSIGPTADGRKKPDLAALGTNVSLVTSSGALSTASGTSYAAPLITGLVAGVWQRYPALSNKEIIEVLKRTASQASNPDTFLGWGIPNYLAVKNLLDFSEQKDEIKIFPNPFNNSLSVRPKNPEQLSSCLIQVINAQGQVLENRNVYFNWLNPTYLDEFPSLSAGLYILRISFQNDVWDFKVVKY